MVAADDEDRDLRLTKGFQSLHEFETPLKRGGAPVETVPGDKDEIHLFAQGDGDGVPPGEKRCPRKFPVQFGDPAAQPGEAGTDMQVGAVQETEFFAHADGLLAFFLR